MKRAKPLTEKNGKITALDKSDIAEMKGICSLPESLQVKLRAEGRPAAESAKKRFTITLSCDIVDAFRATGPGWHKRLDAVLRDWLNEHSPI